MTEAIQLTVTAGQLGIIASILSVGGPIVFYVKRIYDDQKRMIWEHDMMWVDYCVKHNIPIRSRVMRPRNGHAAPNFEEAH